MTNIITNPNYQKLSNNSVILDIREEFNCLIELAGYNNL